MDLDDRWISPHLLPRGCLPPRTLTPTPTPRPSRAYPWDPQAAAQRAPVEEVRQQQCHGRGGNGEVSDQAGGQGSVISAGGDRNSGAVAKRRTSHLFKYLLRLPEFPACTPLYLRPHFQTRPDTKAWPLLRWSVDSLSQLPRPICSYVGVLCTNNSAKMHSPVTFGETNCCNAASISGGLEMLISRLSWLLPSLVLFVDPCPAPPPALRPLAVSPLFCVERSFSSTKVSRTNSSW